MADSSNKTEQPTHKRLEKANKEGQVPVSRDFVGAIQFVTAVALAGSWGAWFFYQMRDVMRFAIRYAFQTSFSNGGLFHLGAMILQQTFLPLGVAGLALLVVTFSSHLSLTRLNFSLKKLQPDLFDLQAA